MLDSVKDYYGKQLQSSSDLKTTACCDASSVPNWLKPLLANIHPEVLSRYYGCGLICPPLLEGCRVLDLGCGSGRDVYALAQLVGKTGEIVGVDMTDEQLAIAQQYKSYHVEEFDFDNITFVKGYIEQLDKLNFAAQSFDVVVSNCVINLSEDKEAVLKGVFNLLKPGGEFYFSDVYADRRIPKNIANDEVLYGECLAGALYWNDFIQLAKNTGFIEPRLVESQPLLVTDTELNKKIGGIRFSSATYRLCKIYNLENTQENYGQSVIYQGDIKEQPDTFILDKHNKFKKNKPTLVSGNTWKTLKASRFSQYFTFVGSLDSHEGLFVGSDNANPFDIQKILETKSCC